MCKIDSGLKDSIEEKDQVRESNKENDNYEDTVACDGCGIMMNCDEGCIFL